MDLLFLGASATSIATCLVHVIVGGKFVARPLLADEELSRVTKFTAYYCWHLVTITIAALALAFFIAATNPAAISLAIFATGGSVLFVVWSLAMITMFKLRPMHFPQWILFLPGAILGMAGILS